MLDSPSEVAGVTKEEDLVGTWKLVSAWSTRPNGERVGIFGEHPIGFLTYTKDGRMAAMLGDSERPALSSDDDLVVPITERAAAFSSFGAYAGTFRVDGDCVIHHVEISLLQNWVGTDQVRRMKLEATRLTLWPPPSNLGGEQREYELVWERLR